jgi:diguanylate cyclase (GGDEF)-like protein
MQLEVERRLRDPLTGLANRNLFLDRLDQALARVRRNGRSLAVLFIDLDRFKQVNDSLGHSAGDDVLVSAAGKLQGSVRVTDLVARLGGDEFAVLCEDLAVETEAVDVAQRILHSFERPFTCDGRNVYVGASLGISYSLNGHESAETLLNDSDSAMYRAKEGGRGRFEIFDQTVRHWVATRLGLESALHQAVDRDEFSLWYQPVLARDGVEVVGFEALLRWDRPDIGLTLPSEFMAVAEQAGVIVRIGEFAMEEACRQAASWAQQWPQRRLEVAVNVSSRQLLTSDIVSLVRRCLDANALDPSLLVLELTETTLIDDAVGARAVLIALRDLGVKIALDDFGTGYSALTYLRTFPIDLIKIDGSFVRTVDTERQAAAIVSAVVDLARHLEMKVIAEGVETCAQMDGVVSRGCDLLQGFLFSPPLAASELGGFLDVSAARQFSDR